MIFDGTDPNTLHVGTLDGSVWTVDVVSESATKSDTAIKDPALHGEDDALNWRFTEDGSGAIVERSDENAEFADDTHLPGIEELDHDQRQKFPELPGYQDITVRTDSGQVLAFGIGSDNPRFLRAYRYPADAAPSADWKRLEPSSPLPNGDDHEVAAVRPPLG